MSLLSQLILGIRGRQRAGKKRVADGAYVGRLDALSFDVVSERPRDKQLSIIGNIIMDFGI